jgi:hypothetical protein
VRIFVVSRAAKPRVSSSRLVQVMIMNIVSLLRVSVCLFEGCVSGCR